VCDERCDVLGASHRLLEARTLRLLVRIEHVRPFGRKPGQYLPQLALDWSVTEGENVVRIETLLDE
jgi:hypothetical protein